MIKVICDMCGCDIDYEKNGVNIDFNHYGVVKFRNNEGRKELQLCTKCADEIYELITGVKIDRNKDVDCKCST